MAVIELSPITLRRARDLANLSTDERTWVDEVIAESSIDGLRVVDLAAAPNVFLRTLLRDRKISDRHRLAITLAVNGLTERPTSVQMIYDKPTIDPIDFGSVMEAVVDEGPNCELEWNGRWYPVRAVVQFPSREVAERPAVQLQVALGTCYGGFIFQRQFTVSAARFEDASGLVERTPRDLLQAIGLRAIQTSATDHNLRLANALRVQHGGFEQMLLSGPVMTRSYYNVARPVPLGTSGRPRKVVIDEVEDRDQKFAAELDASPAALVRVFSLDLKSHVYVDVDDLSEYEYDTDALSRLALPSDMQAVLATLFHTPTEKLFGDVITGKHGGLVVLACGNPGVGKTLTSEIYAEVAERPLYTLELGELGTQVAQIEESLERIFARVARWGAVLQFDECDVFLARRGDDLERSAIVGIFLRLLDYYEGILFLTSNRPEVIDPAVLSRVMLRLDYPDLDAAARRSVWQTMFEAAGLTLIADESDDGDDGANASEAAFDELARTPLDGRQIRNLTRLTRLLFSDGPVSVAQVRSAMKYGYAAGDQTVEGPIDAATGD